MKVIIEKNDQTSNYKLLFNDFDNISKEKFLISVLENKNIQYKKTEFFKNYFIYKLINVNKKIIDDLVLELEKENFVREISPMSVYSLPIRIDEEQGELKTKTKIENDYVTLGVIDNGVYPTKQLKDFLIGVDNPYTSENTSYNHGTFVAAIALYGDELEKREITKNILFNVFDATVLDFTTIEEDDLLKNICIQIENHHKKVKIWNLSLSVRLEIEDNFFSTFGVVLDYLQKTFNVLICKSCGNTGSFMKNGPKRKLYHGSDSQLSLSVGSITNENNHSVFSRIGYAALGTIKPDLVSYGGELYKNDDGTMGMDGVLSLDKNGKIVSSSGTSFANARISGLATSIYQYICKDFINFSDFNREYIKALILHSCEYINNDWKKEEVGYGLHKTFEEIKKLINNKNILIINDKLTDEYKINLKNYFKEDYKNSKFKITLVFDTDFDYSQKNNYFKSLIYIKNYPEKNINLVRKFENFIKEDEIILYSEENNNIEKNFSIIIEKL